MRVLVFCDMYMNQNSENPRILPHHKARFWLSTRDMGNFKNLDPSYYGCDSVVKSDALLDSYFNTVVEGSNFCSSGFRDVWAEGAGGGGGL